MIFFPSLLSFIILLYIVDPPDRTHQIAMGKMERKKGENSGDKRRETRREIGRKKKEKKDGLCKRYIHI